MPDIPSALQNAADNLAEALPRRNKIHVDAFGAGSEQIDHSCGSPLFSQFGRESRPTLYGFQTANDGFVDNDLRIVLNLLAVEWAADAQRYRRVKRQAQVRERAFWFGKSFGLVDSTNELLKLLRRPTVEGVIALAQLLDQRHTRAEHKFSYRHKALTVKTHALGASEGYKRCADNLTMVLVETLCTLKAPVDYLS